MGSNHEIEENHGIHLCTAEPNCIAGAQYSDSITKNAIMTDESLPTRPEPSQGYRVRLLANGACRIILLLLSRESYRGALVLKVLIADDHAVIRQGVRWYLTSIGDMTIVAEAATASDLLAHVSQYACDVLLMDLSLGQASGLEVMRAVKAMRPLLPIVIFTLHEEMAYAKAAFMRGATGYVGKTRPLSEVATALRDAARGRRYVSPPFEEVSALPLAVGPQSLSRRQQQILRLRGQGFHAAEIGAALGIAAKTVSAHEEKILEKLGLPSRHQLLPYAIRQAMAEQDAVEPVKQQRDGP
jgi:two-component system, NarL family, invasion response regulator UvrY